MATDMQHKFRLRHAPRKPMMNPPCQWLIHDALCPEHGLERLHAAIVAAGDDALVLDGRRFHDPLAGAKPDPARPVLVLAPINLARRLAGDTRLQGCTPGLVWSPTAFRQTRYAFRLGDDFLNPEQIFVPWAEFVRRADDWRRYGFVVDETIFVRPDSGDKVFAGQTLPLADFAHHTHALAAVSGITEDTLVAVARPKPGLEREWRFWIGGGDVLATSCYNHDDPNDTTPPPAATVDLARRIARAPWQVDDLYTCDVAETAVGAKVVELNSFSCSGLYRVDLDGLVVATRKLAQRQLADIFEIPGTLNDETT